MSYTPSINFDSTPLLHLSDQVYLVAPLIAYDSGLGFDSASLLHIGSFAYLIPVTIIYGPSIGFDSVSLLHIGSKPYFVSPPIIRSNSINLKHFTLKAAGDDGPAIQLGFVVEFDGTPRVGDRPLIVQFTPVLRDYETLVEWDFGDGVTSGVTAPEHSYAEAGFYEVKLTVEIDGANHTGKKKRYIQVIAREILPNIIDVGAKGTNFKQTYTIQEKQQ